MAESHSATGQGEYVSLSGCGTPSSEPETRRLSELRVIDLRAELKRRSLDSGGNKSVLTERLRKAIEEEGGNPDEIPVTSESTMKRTPKRSSKGRRPDEEGAEDNGLEEDSGDGQEDIETSLDNLQDIDMMDISVLDEAEIDNSNAGDCGEDYSADHILDSLSDRENADAEMKELPDQPPDYDVGDLEASPQLSEIKEESREISVMMVEVEDVGNSFDAASSELIEIKEIEELPLEPENEKILDILGETCKSELLNEETSEAEQPHAQEASNVVPGKRLAEEEDALAAAQSEEDALDLDSKSAQAMARKEAKRLVVAKGETSEQTIEEEKLDSDSVGVESVSDQSSKRCQGLEASSGETAERGAGAEGKDSKEDAKKAEDKANSEESPATKESSASEGGDQKKSPVEEDKDTKQASKDEKGRAGSGSGRNLWVSGLSSSTRATDLKNLFSKYGKVVGAKVVTNARSPGARCYGFVTMASSEEATKCINHLHRTELHGKMISVEKVGGSSHVAGCWNERSGGVKKEEKADKKDDGKKSEKDSKDEKEGKEKEEQKAGASDRSRASKSASRGTERTVVMDKSKGEPVISVKTSASKERSTKSQDRKSESKEKQDILSFDKIKEQRERERQRQREREIRETERRRERERREREQRLQAMHERDERQRLQRERERLEFQRQRLDRERLERERLERERMHIEQERRREQERIQREREELRRQQEQLRYEQERRSAMRRPYDDGRRDDPYWPEAKRVALDDRYHSEFVRQDRFHDFDHRDRGRYQDHSLDRREGSRGIPDRDGQHYPDERHGPERHPRESRDGWGSYGSERRMNEGRGIPPPTRDGRDWGDHGRKLEGHQDRSWQGSVAGGVMGRDHERWQGGDRGTPGQQGPGHATHRGGMAGRGGFTQGPNHSQVAPSAAVQGGFAGQERGHRATEPRFARRY
ncbi:scaffold attachment factor B1-like isoform X3 [Lagopus muta]|uniref:scaffold attachment factor B1-like isoform X3 n=1 Tax=Lagopus muta TaxID=64668 RepID=UPI00209E2D01|nr:scaffold attachment factor B1-like isoform X3 [Lagopus muta]